MQFRMLGPLEVLVNGHPVVLGGARQRATLGFLLLRVNRVVAVSELQDALWAFDEAPPTARKMLQNAVWGLRGLFSAELHPQESAAVVTQAPGYMLRVAPEQVDLHQFHRKVEEGRARLAAGPPEEAARLLGDALALWRGPALADLVETGIAWPGLAAVQSAKLDAMEDYFEAQLACGRHHDVLADLASMVAGEPFRERSCGQLMLALYRCGRQVEALDAYSVLRSLLASDLGLEPSRELRFLQRSILSHDPALFPEGLPKSPEPRTEPRGKHPATGAATPPRSTGAEAPDAAARPRRATVAEKSEPVAPSVGRPHRDAERRRVSLVLINSRFGTGIEQLDAAEIDNVLKAVAGTVQDKAESFGGAVELAIGPLSLAAFGMADSEDCEERAVRAALAVRDHVDAWAVQTSRTAVREPRPVLGLAVVTGEARVRGTQGDGGDPLSVFGSLVERCQTLLSSAMGGEIVVCDRTRRATDAAIVYRPAGGSPDDWQVEGVRGVSGRSDGDASSTCHDIELGLAQGLLEWSLRRRATHLVTVLGDPGAGKSQFLEDLRGSSAAHREGAQWLISRVSASVGNDAMAVLRSMVSTLCRISPEDSPATVHGTLSEALHRWSDFEAERRWLSARLGAVLGLKSKESIGCGTVDALDGCQRFLTNVALREPLVLVFDDVHRAHDDVLDFIEGLASLPVPVPLFVIVTGRSELLRRRPEWGGGQRHTTFTLTSPSPSTGLRSANGPRPGGHRIGPSSDGRRAGYAAVSGVAGPTGFPC
ncbi:BTAD domain-containing putative transcriptional regulator [Streptomyces sp. NBC_01237]|uniref:BTAD domain-containing putative transcriptional regulator n=1 Tax=Streptomyces sp. NBC_01237 TaxID=2903790 RepID=UPI002DDB1781|nr:BTAD domain-containing putative transcriptional regulator [Streptomyces sp. NBC_01237]WRZ76036.1 AAA family ATPase [Streptomyces sp. NBC_01237]